MDQQHQWYYRFEAKGIGRYVLGHRKLKRMLGASAIVRTLVRDELPAIVKAIGGDREKDVLLNAAGRATIGFKSEASLRAFLRIWPLVVAMKAPHLRTAQAWIEWQGSERATREALGARLAAATQQPSLDLPPGNPVTDQGQFRKLPATFQTVQADGKPELVDAAAFEANRRADRSKLSAAIFRDDPLDGYEFPEDLNEMTAGRYIAVIHADGNGVGVRFEGASFAEVKRLSDVIGGASLTALRAAIRETLLEDGNHYILGVPVLFGGDDLVMIVRADRAIAFMQAYAKAFAAAQREGITLSAGIAFVRANHAFHQALHLAEGLCKATKRATGRDRSAVWFHRFTDLLEPEPRRYCCPFPLVDDARLNAVQAVAKELVGREVARGPIRSMLTSLEAQHAGLGPDEVAVPGHDFNAAFERFEVVHARRKGAAWVAELRRSARGARDPKRPDAEPWPDINTLAVVQEAIDG